MTRCLNLLGRIGLALLGSNPVLGQVSACALEAVA